LEKNIEAFLKYWGPEHCVLVTITNQKPLVGKDSCKAAWRSLKRGVIDRRYPNYIRVPERHKNKGQHSHILTQLGVDVRTSFCFASHTESRRAFAKWRQSRSAQDLALARRYTKGYSESAHPVLKAEWSFWRKLCKRGGYGVGRVEVIPVRESAQRLGRYLGKYLTKSFGEREKEDHGSKLVSYGKESRWWSTRFTWFSPASNLRRAKLSRMAQLLSIDARTQIHDFDDFKVVLGRRWAHSIVKLIPQLLLPVSDYVCCMSLDGMLRYWDRDRSLYAHIRDDRDAVEASTEWILSQLWKINAEHGRTLGRFPCSCPPPALALGECERHQPLDLRW
jgi:hypothetical protein